MTRLSRRIESALAAVCAAEDAYKAICADSTSPAPIDAVELKARIRAHLGRQGRRLEHVEFRLITSDEAQAGILKSNNIILTGLREIRQLVYGGGWQEFRRRWGKTCRKKRKKLLDTAWGTLMNTVNLDDSSVTAAVIGSVGVPERSDDYQDFWTYAQINHASLAEGDALLDFLNTRARIDLTDLARTDLLANGTRFDSPIGAGPLIFIVDCPYAACKLDSESASSAYAQLFVGTEGSEAWKMLRSGLYPCFQDTRTLLDRQERLYQFAGRMASSFGDLGSDDTVTVSLDHRNTLSPSDSYDTDRDLESSPDLGPIHSLVQLHRWITAQKLAACQSIAQMRADLLLFAETIAQDQSDLRVVSPQQTSEKEARDWCTLNSVRSGFRVLEVWTIIAQATEVAVQREREAKASPNETNKEALHRSKVELLVVAERLLGREVHRFIEAGKRSSQAAVLFSLPTDGPLSPGVHAVRAMVQLLEKEDTSACNVYYVGAFRMMTEDHRNWASIGLPKGLLTAHVQIGVLCMCIRQIVTLQRWRPTEQYALKSRLDLLEELKNSWLERPAPNWWQDVPPKESGFALALRRWTTHAKTVYRYARAKGCTRTEAAVGRLRTEEGHLDEFWRLFDEHHREKLPGGLRVSFPRDDTKRTAPWTPRSVNSLRLATNQESPMTSVVDSTSLLPAASSGEALEVVPRKNQSLRSKKKSKVKTRKTEAATSSEIVEATTEATFDPNEQQVIEVDTRAKDAFSVLLPEFVGTENHLSVKFEDFQHAMTAAGCREERVGRPWRYFLEKDDTSVIFRPPPNGKLSLKYLNEYRHLLTCFGWTHATFVARQ